MEAASLAKRAEATLEQGNAEEALDLLTQAISKAPTSPTFYLKRSRIHQRQARYGQALADADQSLYAAVKRGKREDIGEAQLRRAVALFSLERYGDAKKCVEWAKKAGAKANILSVWEAKLKTKLKDLEPSDAKLNETVVEIPDPTTAAQHANPSSAAAPTPTTGPSIAPSKPQTAQPNTGSTTPAKSIRHEWYQNNDNVYLSLFAKNVPQDKAVVDIQPNFVNVSFPLDSGADYDFSLDPFFSKVLSDTASYRILPSKIEMTLPKAIPGLKWAGLEGEHATANDNAPITQSLPTRAPVSTIPKASAPLPSPYASRAGDSKDWDKIAASFQKSGDDAKGKDTETSAAKKEEPSKQDEAVYLEDEDEYEGDPANFFFKKIYAGASDEQKRAMMKSYQESGGTTLSTNWDEVSKAPVTPSPPDGMEAKKW